MTIRTGYAWARYLFGVGWRGSACNVWASARMRVGQELLLLRAPRAVPPGINNLGNHLSAPNLAMLHYLFHGPLSRLQRSLPTRPSQHFQG